MFRRALPLVVAALVVIPILLVGQEARSSAPSIQGVWRLQEVAITGGNNPRTIKNPQPYLRIYTGRHYSLVGITTPNGEPRKAAAQAGENSSTQLTDAQKVQRYEEWVPFVANSGTYEIKGSTLIHRAIVAKNETVMRDSTGGGVNQPTEFKIDGKTLWLTTRNLQTKSETRGRYTRLE